MDIVKQFVAPALMGAAHSVDVERYVSFFEQSVAHEVPPYFLHSYGTSFRLHIENPVWVIQSLVSNAIKEGEGSRDLGAVADACDELEISADLAVHIGDEARHCRMYVQLIDTVFPEALPEAIRTEIVSKFPPLTYRPALSTRKSSWKILDYLIQINLGEVRTRVHQKLLEPVLHAYCPSENREALCRTMCKLSEDECCHIQYTAARIGALSREFNNVEVQQLFQRRMLEFSQYTNRELGRQSGGLFGAPLIRDK